MSHSTPTSTGTGLIQAQVTAIRLEAPDVLSVELLAPDGSALPPADPGMHVDLHLPNGVARPYSIVANEEGAYLLGIKREARSLGASAYVHDRLRVGDSVGVAVPRQKFALTEEAENSILIAGGIGITPLISMARALHDTNRPWQLHYASRHAKSSPFARRLKNLGNRVHVYGSRSDFDARLLDIGALVGNAPPGTHFYCCGPAGMLGDFVSATRDLDPALVHLERFEPATPPFDAGAFDLHLARSDRHIKVHAHQSALDALLAHGVDIDYSCRQGICGSCQARVLHGVPDHRDEVLTEAERAANRSIILCCSRACSSELVLDL